MRHYKGNTQQGGVDCKKIVFLKEDIWHIKDKIFQSREKRKEIMGKVSSNTWRL